MKIEAVSKTLSFYGTNDVFQIISEEAIGSLEEKIENVSLVKRR